MRTLTKLSALAILAASAIACGGDGGEVEQRECGPGTVLVDGQCEVDESNCGEGSVLNDEGQCEPTGEICGENTTYDAGEGRCVPNIGIQCAEGTVEVDGECVPEDAIECAEGTVVANNQCVPADDVCGDGTEPDSQDRCRPSDAACGDGTSFDVATRTCVPTSQLSCGAGTIQIEGTCRLRAGVVADLAATATLNLDEAGETPVDLVSGEALVFTGNIDSPEMVEGEYVQDLDTLLINGTPGQWIRVAIHADGMPEPGFVFMEEVAEPTEPVDPEAEEPPAPFSRTSDAGAGLDFSREIVIPTEGVYALNVGPIAQLLELAGPAGGEDWGYVGSIELIDAPTPTAIELTSEGINGDLRNLSENFYAVSGAQAVDPYIVFSAFGADAMAEVQIWSDAQTLVETIPGEGNSFSLQAPGEDFFILVDRVMSSGPANGYAMSFEQGQNLDAETSFTEEVTLNAGQYVRVTQWNDAGESLPASITAGEDTLESASALALRTATSGTRGLYYVADETVTLTVTIENDTEEALAGVFEATVLDVFDIGESDQDFESERTITLAAGQRDFATVNFTSEGYRIISTDADVELALLNADGDELASGTGSVGAQLSPGEYNVVVDANVGLTAYTLTGVYTETTGVSETSSPGLTIADDVADAEDSVSISGCASVLSASVDVNISHTFQGDLVITLIAPDGTEVILKSRSGGTAEDVIGNFPGDLEPVDDFSILEGLVGNGDWTLIVSDRAGGDDGTLNSWGLNLVCVD